MMKKTILRQCSVTARQQSRGISLRSVIWVYVMGMVKA